MNELVLAGRPGLGMERVEIAGARQRVLPDHQARLQPRAG
jgi:hypothetical protein